MRRYILLVLLFFNIGCKKLDIPSLTIFGKSTRSELTDVSVKVTTQMIDVANGVTQHGYCWAITSQPTIDNNKVTLGILSGSNDGAISFSSEIINLTRSTRYFIRAFIQTGDAVLYGQELDFTTLTNSPFILANAVNNISNTTAEVQGTIIKLEPETSQHGHCWATQASPTINDAKTELNQPATTGTFTSNLTDLQPGQKYFVRSYSIGSGRTVVYSNELFFTTLSN
ncbi:hypothetical protein BKI52_04000 [marine bacterium AO1-C]|nr:hypothetical protein BKI52_04000 [marine bacterium AO1-C]